MKAKAARWLELVTCSVVLMASFAHAEFDYERYIKRTESEAGVTAEQVRVTTPSYDSEVNSFNPNLGTYTYDVTWAGIPAATATVDVESQGENYLVSARVRTSRGIDWIYRLRAEMTGRFSKSQMKPIDSTFFTAENSRRKFSQMKFMDNGDIYAVRGKKGKGASAVQFNTGNFTLDPFSAAFLARGLKWKRNQSRVFDTYNGKSRYLINLTCVDELTMKINGTERRVWVISPQVKKLLNDKKSKLREARIYVTADRYREIIRIESEVFIGTVKTTLVSFTPAAPKASALAQRK